jgi:hypothetical protein
LSLREAQRRSNPSGRERILERQQQRFVSVRFAAPFDQAITIRDN